MTSSSALRPSPATRRLSPAVRKADTMETLSTRSPAPAAPSPGARRAHGDASSSTTFGRQLLIGAAAIVLLVGAAAVHLSTRTVDEATLRRSLTKKDCEAVSPIVSDAWCNTNCNHPSAFCPPVFCKCSGSGADSSDDSSSDVNDKIAAANQKLTQTAKAVCGPGGLGPRDKKGQCNCAVGWCKDFKGVCVVQCDAGQKGAPFSDTDDVDGTGSKKDQANAKVDAANAKLQQTVEATCGVGGMGPRNKKGECECAQGYCTDKSGACTVNALWVDGDFTCKGAGKGDSEKVTVEESCGVGALDSTRDKKGDCNCASGYCPDSTGACNLIAAWKGGALTCDGITDDVDDVEKVPAADDCGLGALDNTRDKKGDCNCAYGFCPDEVKEGGDGRCVISAVWSQKSNSYTCEGATQSGETKGDFVDNKNDQKNQKTAECSKDADCDNGKFCDGAEICKKGECYPGSNPCKKDDECHEDKDQCKPKDCFDREWSPWTRIVHDGSWQPLRSSDHGGKPDNWLIGDSAWKDGRASTVENQHKANYFAYPDMKINDYRLQGYIMTSDADDDIWGFVFGFTGIESPYYLFQWKQTEQGDSENRIRAEGWTFNKKTLEGADESKVPHWTGEGGTFQLLDKNTGAGTGWVKNRAYFIQLEYLSGCLRFRVTDTVTNVVILEYTDNGTFVDGGFAYYTVSQRDVYFYDFEISTVLKVGDACDDGLKCTHTDVVGSDGVCSGTPFTACSSDGDYCNGDETGLTCNETTGCAAAAPCNASTELCDAKNEQCLPRTCPAQSFGAPINVVHDGSWTISGGNDLDNDATTDWTIGDGAWTGSKLSATDSYQPYPSFAAFSDTSLQTYRLTGKFIVTKDDDTLGFAWGFDNPLEQYYLFTWKATAQAADGGIRDDGWMINHKTSNGQDKSRTEHWSGLAATFNLLDKNTGAGTGWAKNTEYEIVLNYQPNCMSFVITETASGNTVVDWAAVGPTNPGGFAYYVLAQWGVDFYDFQLETPAAVTE